jgi:diguanylate cyclase (GGDEF)-like protein
MGQEEEYTHVKGWIKRLAALDPATGLLNRHGWIASAIRQAKRVAKGRKRLGVVLVGVDDFKRVTEDRGYKLGEEALQHLADVIENQLRPGDLLGRWLEDQFIVLLLSPEGSSLKMIAERIRKAIEGSPLRTTQGDISLTICIGATDGAPQTGDLKELDGLISEADRRLAVAKKDGVNRVMV